MSGNVGTLELVKAINEVSAQAVKAAIEVAGKELQALTIDAHNRIDDLFTRRPVLDVKINNEPERALSKKASPHLARTIINARLGLNTLLVGPAGCGKTTMAHQLSEALGIQFGSVCLTAGASETWLFGRQTPVGFVEGMFSKIYREGGVFLADEMDAADANLLLSINTALSHSEMLNPMNGEVIKKHKDFVFIGAANTNGKGADHLYTGRSRLDAATLDRFTIIMVDYDKDIEMQLCPNNEVYKALMNLRTSLKNGGYDEFISTRAFSSSHLQVKQGIGIDEVLRSLSANWSASAKDMVEDMIVHLASVGYKSKKSSPSDPIKYKKIEDDIPW